MVLNLEILIKRYFMDGFVLGEGHLWTISRKDG